MNQVRETEASALQRGDVVQLKTGAKAVAHTILYALLPGAEKRFVDVFFVGQTYPLYYREDIEVDVVGHINLDAVEYAVKVLAS